MCSPNDGCTVPHEVYLWEMETIRAAYDGGQRLMLSELVEKAREMLDIWWNRDLEEVERESALRLNDNSRLHWEEVVLDRIAGDLPECDRRRTHPFETVGPAFIEVRNGQTLVG